MIRATGHAWAWMAASLLAFRAGDVTAASSSQPAGRERADRQAAAASGLASSSDTDDLALLSLEVPIVVTAARHEQKITDIPAAVSVITAEDIRWSGARSIPDALRLVPGIDVADLGCNAYAVSPRGYHGLLSNDVVVLVDGRQIFDSLFGGTVWGSWPFQLEDIERIEVIRSSGGVTWGANTPNGVINIITKDPKDQVGMTATGGGGTQGSHKEHLGYAFADGKLRMRVSGEYEGSDGFPKGGSLLSGLDDGLKTGRMGVHAIYDAGPKDKVTLSGGSAVVNGGYPPTPLAGFGQQHSSESQAEFLLGKWDHTIAEDNRFNVTGYVNDFQLCPGLPVVDYRYQQLALQLGHTFKPAQEHTLTWGIDSRTDLLDASLADPVFLSRDHVSTAIIGAYVQDEWRFAPRWMLSLGARIDYEFYGGFEPSARGALSYELADKSLIYGAVSRAFRSQPLGVRFVEAPMLNGLGYMTGHRDLPEATVMAYEVGWHKNFFDRLNAKADLFWNDYRDLAAFVPRPGPPGLLRLDFDNVASSDLYGAELDVQYKVTKGLTLLGNYTWQQFGWDAPVGPAYGEMITPPKHKFMLGARYDPTDDLHLSSHLYYVDSVWAPNSTMPFLPRHVSQYFRLDLRAEYEFWKKRASVAVGVRNLLDSNHYEGGTIFLNSAEAPRMVYAEVRMTLK